MTISFELRAFTQCTHFHFSFFFPFSLNLFCYFLVLSCSVFFLLIFQADTSLFLFHLIVENLILHILLIIMIIIPCSGMFRNVPGCTGMFHVPGFIDGPNDPQSAARRTSSCGRKKKFLRVHYFWAVLYCIEFTHVIFSVMKFRCHFSVLQCSPCF